jgi:hypothetical protein
MKLLTSQLGNFHAGEILRCALGLLLSSDPQLLEELDGAVLYTEKHQQV